MLFQPTSAFGDAVYMRDIDLPAEMLSLVRVDSLILLHTTTLRRYWPRHWVQKSFAELRLKAKARALARRTVRSTPLSLLPITPPQNVNLAFQPALLALYIPLLLSMCVTPFAKRLPPWRASNASPNEAEFPLVRAIPDPDPASARSSSLDLTGHDGHES